MKAVEGKTAFVTGGTSRSARHGEGLCRGRDDGIPADIREDRIPKNTRGSEAPRPKRQAAILRALEEDKQREATAPELRPELVESPNPSRSAVG